MQTKKVLLAIATPGVLKTATTQSLFGLLAAPPCEVSFFLQSGVYVDTQRNIASRHALEHGFDYIFFIDNDMEFNSSLLESLIAADKDVISTNYVMKLEPAIPMAMYEDRTRVGMKNGLEQVYAAPTGTMLIKTEVFKKIGKDEWFSRFKDEFTGEQFGEDVAFCERCKKNEIEIWIDHDLTKTIGHWGEKRYTWEDVLDLPERLLYNIRIGRISKEIVNNLIDRMIEAL